MFLILFLLLTRRRRNLRRLMPFGFLSGRLVFSSGLVRMMSLAVLLVSVSACRQDMHDQPKLEALESSSFFPDGRASRPLVPGTVARGQLRNDPQLYTGKVNNEFVDSFPFPVTKEVLERGRERFNIFCTPCHDYTGNGEGMVVRRGFKQPPSFHIDRLRKAAAGYLFDVITNGFGAMQDYAAQVKVEDRWAIVAYIRALQLSQNASAADTPPEELERLRGKSSRER
ncbi:MAG: cytochrome c [Acidobacteriota bacterium]